MTTTKRQRGATRAAGADTRYPAPAPLAPRLEAGDPELADLPLPGPMPSPLWTLKRIEEYIEEMHAYLAVGYNPGLIRAKIANAEAARAEKLGDLPAPVGGVALVITGHTPLISAGWTQKNVLCIDSGLGTAHEDGALTIVEIHSGELHLHRFARRGTIASTHKR